MVNIRELPIYIWALMLAGILAGVGVLVNDELAATMSTDAQGNLSKGAIANATEGVANMMEQIPTVGTIVGVSLIVGVVVLLFVAFRGTGSTY